MSRPFRRPLRGKPRRHWRGVGIVAAVVALALAGFLAVSGVFDRDPIHVFPATGRRASVAALFFSGDVGLRYGMGPATTRLLAAHGIETVGFSSPTLFATKRTPQETAAIVADAIRTTIARTGQDRIVLIGQSFGADVLQTGLATLPGELRRHVAGIVLVVPGNVVFLRADPSSLSYRGTPDGQAIATARTLDWAPLTCIYGVQETDSLCPLLHLANARVIGMRGGHFLANDADALGAQVLRAVAMSIRPSAPPAAR
jgi:type IV secretory pathway VirJ component